MLGVADVRVSIEFYTQQLAFKLGDTAEHNGDLSWAHLCHGDTELMLTEVPNPESGREGRKQLFLYFYVEDVVALHSKFSGKEIPISPMRVTEYAMKEFEVEDPDGYQLWFGEGSDEPPTDCE